MADRKIHAAWEGTLLVEQVVYLRRLADEHTGEPRRRLLLAAAVLELGTDWLENTHAARALGKLGAAKGGRARAASLGPATRRRIAQNAARARWAKRAALKLG